VGTHLDPAGASSQLAQLADEVLRDEVRAHLAEYAAAEHRAAASGDDSASIYCTWRFAELSASTQHRLRQLGFAAALFRHAPAPLKDSPRLALAGTALLMLGMTALAVAAYRWYRPEPPRLLVQDAVYNHPTLAAQTVRRIDPVGSTHYHVTLGSARHLASLLNVLAGADIPVSWRWEAGDNAVYLEGSDRVLLRAGRLAQPIRACGDTWPQRSLVVIAAPFADDPPAPRQLAIRLLDTGSADQVLLAIHWQQALAEWLGPSASLNRATQVLVILPDATGVESAAARLASHPGPWAVTSSGDFAGLARAVNFRGSKAVGQVSSLLRVHHARGNVRVYGGPERQTDGAGIDWVNVCPGTFTMGTITGEDMKVVQDEIVHPPRTVVLSALQIAATETTQQQVGQTGDKPVVDVTWAQARAFCQKIDGDLPTEAQWEYAARGGSRFPWSFGDAEAQLGRYAWFGENLAGQAHEVKKKLPNPLGLYDMHGNVWEWVRDWYGAYTSGVFVDPLGPGSGKCTLFDDVCRVVRGGSFDVSPVALRSANRDDFRPERRVRDFGFRCVRVPPQP
jgi:formylglycine-generating enzyme required for sulfatase activity